MIIKAVKYFEKGFHAQGFAFGGEEGAEHFDNNVKYRASLQNYVIDTGEDIIQAPAEMSGLFLGSQTRIFMIIQDTVISL